MSYIGAWAAEIEIYSFKSRKWFEFSEKIFKLRFMSGEDLDLTRRIIRELQSSPRAFIPSCERSNMNHFSKCKICTILVANASESRIRSVFKRRSHIFEVHVNRGLSVLIYFIQIRINRSTMNIYGGRHIICQGM